MKEQTYLVIDIGNTAQKAALFDEQGEEKGWMRKSFFSCDDIDDFLAGHAVTAAIVSSVGEAPTAIEDFLRTRTRTLTFSPQLRLPVRLRYATPHTLGTDRIAGAVGAHTLFPGCNVLAIQVGSCLVADFVTAGGEYLGGSIAPGLRMRLRALNQFTARLPLLEAKPIDYLVGDSTEKSILSGVTNGLTYEIDGLISQYQTQFSDVKAVLTGGDAPLLTNSLKNSIFAAPNLVLSGLYEILKLNV